MVGAPQFFKLSRYVDRAPFSSLRSTTNCEKCASLSVRNQQNGFRMLHMVSWNISDASYELRFASRSIVLPGFCVKLVRSFCPSKCRPLRIFMSGFSVPSSGLRFIRARHFYPMLSPRIGQYAEVLGLICLIRHISGTPLNAGDAIDEVYDA